MSELIGSRGGAVSVEFEFAEGRRGADSLRLYWRESQGARRVDVIFHPSDGSSPYGTFTFDPDSTLELSAGKFYCDWDGSLVVTCGPAEGASGRELTDFVDLLTEAHIERFLGTTSYVDQDADCYLVEYLRHLNHHEGKVCVSRASGAPVYLKELPVGEELTAVAVGHIDGIDLRPNVEVGASFADVAMEDLILP